MSFITIYKIRHGFILRSAVLNARYYVRRSQFLKHSKPSYARYYVRRLTPGITYASVSFSNIPKRPVLRTYYVRQFLVSETFQIELRPVLRTSTYARYYVRQRQFPKHATIGFYPSYVNALMYVYTYIQIKTMQSMQFIGKAINQDTNTGFDSLSQFNSFPQFINPKDTSLS